MLLLGIGQRRDYPGAVVSGLMAGLFAVNSSCTQYVCILKRLRTAHSLHVIIGFTACVAHDTRVNKPNTVSGACAGHWSHGLQLLGSMDWEAKFG